MKKIMETTTYLLGIRRGTAIKDPFLLSLLARDTVRLEGVWACSGLPAKGVAFLLPCSNPRP